MIKLVSDRVNANLRGGMRAKEYNTDRTTESEEELFVFLLRTRKTERQDEHMR